MSSETLAALEAAVEAHMDDELHTDSHSGMWVKIRGRIVWNFMPVRDE